MNSEGGVARASDRKEYVPLRDQAVSGMFICHHPMCKAEGLVLDNLMGLSFDPAIKQVTAISLNYNQDY